MLQIITGKFFTGSDVHTTLHRVVFTTNYRMFSDEIHTVVGNLKRASHTLSPFTMIYEVEERLEREGGSESHDGSIKPISLVSVGSTELANDFAAAASFFLEILITPDAELANRLLQAQRPSPSVHAPARDFVDQMFDQEVNMKPHDSVRLAGFFQQLVGLPRSQYELVMRAIRRYVTGLQRVSDDLDLSYTLLVASLEALAQQQTFMPTWDQYEPRKRSDIDSALATVAPDDAEAVRLVLLKHEHLALGSRFRAFVLAHLPAAFFRDDAVGRPHPVSRPDLETTLRNAYTLRSKYVHELQQLPGHLTVTGIRAEVSEVDGGPMLTHRGLARVARAVILEYIGRQPQLNKEEFDYRRALPGIVTMRLSPMYWVGNASSFTPATAQGFLNGFLAQLSAALQGQDNHLPDMRGICLKIQQLMPSANAKNRRTMLLLYFLANAHVIESSRVEGWLEFVNSYEMVLDKPSIEAVIGNALFNQHSGWESYEADRLWSVYLQQRTHKNGLKMEPFLEAVILLHLAEVVRQATGLGNASTWISRAVESFPGNSALIELENAANQGKINEIDWKGILGIELSSV